MILAITKFLVDLIMLGVLYLIYYQDRKIIREIHDFVKKIADKLDK
jgi:hypothetical protein